MFLTRLTATCSGTMRVWIDEEINPTNSFYGDDWKNPADYDSPHCAQVIAIQCTDEEDIGIGILASMSNGVGNVTSNGVVTDASWKCSRNYESKWRVVGFDDSAWSSATVYGPNPTSPWNHTFTGILATASWIGIGNRYDTQPHGTGPVLYCRKTL